MSIPSTILNGVGGRCGDLLPVLLSDLFPLLFGDGRNSCATSARTSGRMCLFGDQTPSACGLVSAVPSPTDPRNQHGFLCFVPIRQGWALHSPGPNAHLFVAYDIRNMMIPIRLFSDIVPSNALSPVQAYRTSLRNMWVIAGKLCTRSVLGSNCLNKE